METTKQCMKLVQFNNLTIKTPEGRLVFVLMLTDCTYCLGVLITDFEQVNAGWVSETAGTCKFNVIINAIYINVLNINLNSFKLTINNVQKMKFYIEDFLSKCDQIRRKLRIWSHLLKKSLMETSFFVKCLVRIQYECGKIQTRKTLNTDTFYAVLVHVGWV